MLLLTRQFGYTRTCAFMRQRLHHVSAANQYVSAAQANLQWKPWKGYGRPSGCCITKQEAAHETSKAML